jgi:Flp pilus assembly protein TadD
VPVLATIALGACASDPRTTAPRPGADLAPFQSARAHAGVAQDLDASGDIHGAIHAYQLAREADPLDYQWVAHRLAVLHARSGDTATADLEFRRAWRLNPHDPAVLADWHTLGAAHNAGAHTHATGY